MAPTCPNYDLEATDPSQFYDGHSITWKRHYIGWGIAGICTFLSTVISFRLLYKHARNYTKPAEQRHIMRIVLMIPIYSFISFLSYRFYKQAIYYETIRDCYEAFVIHSFFMLLLTYLGEDTEVRKSRINAGPERMKLVFPLNCWYYNPQGELFLRMMSYGVLQYVVVKPATTIAAVILEYKGLYCETMYSFAYGKVYITIINFISVTIAMYFLVVFYVTIKSEIQEQKPFLKFLCVKLVIFFCFWQTCLLSLIGHFDVFKATEYWSVNDIEMGINGLLVCVEMVVFAILHVYSFSYIPYISNVTTSVCKSLRDGFNPIDLFREIGWACKDIILIIMGKPLPTRDGHLSGAVKRAQTVRTKARLFRKKRKMEQASLSSSPPDANVDPSTLEAGGRFINRGDQILTADAQRQNVPLLSHVDGASLYEMQELEHANQRARF